MLDIKFIRENRDVVKKNCELRNIQCDIDRLLELDEKRRKLMQEIEELRNEKNRLNELFRKTNEQIREAGFEENRKEVIKKGEEIKNKLNDLGSEWEMAEEKFRNLLLKIPNISHPDSPIGKDDSENREIKRYGEPPTFDFEPKGHEELMTALDLVDFERGGKVAGAKFYFFENE